MTDICGAARRDEDPCTNVATREFDLSCGNPDCPPDAECKGIIVTVCDDHAKALEDV